MPQDPIPLAIILLALLFGAGVTLLLMLRRARPRSFRRR